MGSSKLIYANDRSQPASGLRCREAGNTTPPDVVVETSKREKCTDSTLRCCPLHRFAAVTQLRHSSVVSPEPCLKHSVISTTLLRSHEISYPSTTADGQLASVLHSPEIPLAGATFHAPLAKKHLTEPLPQDLDQRLLRVPPLCTRNATHSKNSLLQWLRRRLLQFACFCATRRAMKTLTWRTAPIRASKQVHFCSL